MSLRATTCLSLCLLCTAITSQTFGQTSLGGPDPNVIQNGWVIAIWQNDVPAKEPGVITELLIEEGQMVRLDQVIAKIDERDAQMAVMVAKKKWEAAQVQADSDVSVRAAAKQRDLFNIELERKLKVNAAVRDAVSETEIRETTYRRDRAVLEIEASQHQMKVAVAEAAAAMSEAQRAKEMLANRQVKSPVEGFVTKVIRRQGTWVSPGEPVANIVQMNPLRVMVRVRYQDHPQATLNGRRAEVVVDVGNGRSEAATGVVGYTNMAIDQQSGLYEAWIEIDNRKDSAGRWIFTPGMDAAIHLK